ncbi:acyl-CoA synthetase (AMP-forming)/AMP-acid ligase II [Schinkia azotoformans MEV2011]|uniref:Acyl-CoA synthetase (AMP-forming)/AMP-acid ligase II n=1 Tax=Schinkia azotoformans MEV2011 TaxID=1348973 RepID=A0A072NX77_SCHAZ|nr:crotonobetaine/carnitine-CoA ligase [Schinkia azotoformans]KEF37835.1 acyl-CoA synthetase (AMP-forming)/AMP-acid ligase II [Schinkia azotoformans MEV2011]MEC1696517.1 crotonobetaine/carnitine-CoA ligase [Schinkia azotoformans]MEC1725992.1 crotonobetaine/carnitine-CoA ligase [Schinkia azotoformans]MEC1745797.1 crotonobetaine/carnitine-CoA ligase [Schinkia azotoformans]MEC1770061.1 crotonobetaine/carnitine-CoA ligase [Schinkia azotoformans]
MADIVGNKTIRDIWDEMVWINGEKTVLIFHGCDDKIQEFSYQHFNEEINKTANLFLDLGIQKGDKVAIQLYNCPEFLMSWFGLAKIGAIMVPLNTQLTQEECEYIIKKCGGVVAAVIEEEFLPYYHTNGQILDNGIKHLLLARSKEHTPGTINFWENKEAQPVKLKENRPLTSDDVAEILFTSGTTSMPKGVVITHANMIFAGIFTAWQLSLRNDDRFLTIMPAFHVDFQLNTMMPILIAGGTLISLTKYSARKFWKQVCSYQATITECIPMMIRTMMMQPQQKWEKNHCLREVFFYLALTEKEKNEFEERFNVRLFNSYGLSESLVGVIGDSPCGERHWPSIGKPGLTYEAKIIDEEGNELPPNTIGEIYIKGVPGRTLMKEYHNDPEATRKTLSPDGWMHTGDKGYVDESGWFYFVDRKVNMIKRSGENISTTEIENVLMTHPKIEEAAVIGVPDPIRDQAVKAFIIVKDGEVLNQEEILEYCKGHMAKFKVPSFIEIRKSLPRTCTYKVQKKLLK